MSGFALRTGAVAVGIFTIAALGRSPAAVQAPPQQQPPIFRGGTNVVRVDVTVTDRRGEPAVDLARDDFSLTEDGAPQTIDSFELVRATGESTDDRSLEIHSQSQVATEAARDDVRLFLIFWDEYHIGQFIPALRGRETLTEFVRTAFGPTDLVGIMDQLTTLDSIRFTRERMDLLNQIHALKGRFGLFIPARSPVEEAHLQFPREIGRLRNEVTTSALTAAAAFLGNFREGRKAILFVSQGLPIFGRSNETQSYMEIVRTANTNNTAIYTLDPASEVGRRPDSLMSLAGDTGGRSFAGSNRPELLLPQMVRDSSAYYLLGYRSPAPVDGKFHRIKVRLNKDGYDVRARSGYFAPSVGELERGRADAAAAAAVPTDIERAIGELSTTGRSERRIDYWIGMARGEGGRTRVTVAWTPTVSRPTDGEIALALSAVAPDGSSYFRTDHTTSREVSFDAPAGELVLATTAFNARGDEIDADRRRVTVPTLDGSQLAIGSPVVFRTRTARDARAVTEGTEVHPEVGREFYRNDRLFVRFPVYGGEGAATARLLNRRGAELRALTVAPVREGMYQLDIPLSASAPGEYVIAIEARRGDQSVRTLVPIRVR